MSDPTKITARERAACNGPGTYPADGPGRLKRSGSLAMFAAMRRASSHIIKFAADRRPGSSS